MLPMLDLYDFKMSLFDNVNPEGFLLFVHNFYMTLGASGMLEVGSKYSFLRTIFCGEALRQFDLLSADV